MILIVEANKKLSGYLGNLIKENLGHKSLELDNPQEISWHMESTSFDLILINPEIDNFEAVKELRSMYSMLEMPIMTVTGFKKRDIILESLSRGVNDCITLPFDPEIAAARIKTQLLMRVEYKHARDSPPPTPSGNTLTIKDSNPGGPAREDRIRMLEDIYEPNSGEGVHIPCEMLFNLVVGTRNYFCKTIWITQHHILILSFEDFAPAGQYRVQIPHPKGDSVEADVVETKRQKMSDKGVGALKIHLKITRASKAYDNLYYLFHQAFQAKGVAGLNAILQGQDIKPNEQQENNSPQNRSAGVAPVLSMVKGRRYNYRKLLGRGGFASVHLVEDIALKRSVAMKILNPGFSKVKESRESFLVEAQIAAQFHHPNIVFVYEVGEFLQPQYQDYLKFPGKILKENPTRMIYFTMQYVEGLTLKQWIRNGDDRTEEIVLHIMEDIAKALAFAHSKGVIHRDIKPDNIMITDDSHVLVMDFGIATLTQEPTMTPKMDEDGENISILCTPKYASPEQLQGQDIDHRADIYSFGVLAYEMLVGRPPFGGKALPEIINKQLNKRPAPIHKHREDITPDLERIVLKCLAKKRDDRYQNAQGILDDLEALKEANTGSTSGDTLDALLEQCMLVSESKAAGLLLERLIAFVHLHKTYDNVTHIDEVKSKLTDHALLNLIIKRNLNAENQHLLYEFFLELESTRAVPELLHWFKSENEMWKKAVLGELAVLSAGRDLIPLAIFGLELHDEEACILLRGFGEIAIQHQDPIFQKWSRHPGIKTQTELIKIMQFHVSHRPKEEVIAVLEQLTRSRGPKFADVRKRAEALLTKF